jgi:hypothetical protein
MKNKLIKCWFILVLFSFNVYSSFIVEVPLEEEVEEAILIIKGKVVKKYSKIENIKHYYYDRNRDIKESKVKDRIYTTFVFNIDDVLYGAYENNSIEVKMQGGCYDTGICEGSSWDYDFDIEEQGVIFLKHIYKSKYFTSTAGSYSAFAIDENNNLYRKSHNYHGKNKSEIKHDLSLKLLKTAINQMKKNAGN